jgi:hypothetical protein
MRNLFLAAGTALMLAGTTSAWAETLKFSYSGTSFPNNDPAAATWFQPSDPVPIGSDLGPIISVTGGFETNNGVPSTFSSVEFVNQFGDGGFVTGGGLQVVGGGGGQVYGGTDEAPIFTVGTWTLTTATIGDGGVGGTNAGTLVVSVAVPELSTWGMMALGFAGIGLFAHRRARRHRGQPSFA